jgi:PAS domain S-box-containing protein
MNKDPRANERVARATLDPRDRTALEGITAEWRKASDALQDTERRYRELVEYSLGLICTHDLTGTILSINPAAADSLGYLPEDGVGKNLRDFLSPDKRSLFEDYLGRIQEQGHDAGLMSVLSREGATRIWMYRNVLSHGPNREPYVLGHAIDITERFAAELTLRENEKALEERVKERTTALELANERLQVEIADRKEAEQARERAFTRQRETMVFLSTFSDRLAPVVTFEDLVEVVRQLPVPFLADWTMVHFVNADGTVRCVPGVHAAAGHERTLASLAISASGDPQPGSLLAGVIAAAHTAIVHSNPATLADDLMGTREPLPPFEQLGMAAVALVPFVFDGKVKAVLSLASGHDQGFDPPNALVVEHVARRIRLAAERIQLFREAQEANRLKDEFLSTLSHELRTR